MGRIVPTGIGAPTIWSTRALQSRHQRIRIAARAARLDRGSNCLPLT
jgi:hypothetical protein